MNVIRKARLGDVKRIHSLVNQFAGEGRMLALALSELYDNLRDFTVACDAGEADSVLGCCALHIVWEDLAEIRSLAVVSEEQGKGIGRELVEACLSEARSLGVRRVFALTCVPDFFARFGFRPVEKSELPHKVWTDCVKCPKFPDCDEVAVVRNV